MKYSNDFYVYSEAYEEALKKVNEVSKLYKLELIKAIYDIISKRPHDIGLNEAYENKYGWGKALTFTTAFGEPMKTFGTIERFKDMPRTQTAESLYIKELEKILNNVENL